MQTFRTIATTSHLSIRLANLSTLAFAQRMWHSLQGLCGFAFSLFLCSRLHSFFEIVSRRSCSAGGYGVNLFAVACQFVPRIKFHPTLGTIDASRCFRHDLSLTGIIFTGFWRLAHLFSASSPWFCDDVKSLNQIKKIENRCIAIMPHHWMQYVHAKNVITIRR